MAAIPGHAEVYKWVDEGGNTHYSDEAPDKDAKPVELKPLPTMPFEKLHVPEATRPDTEKEADETTSSHAAGYDSLQITSPANDATIRRYDEPIAVTATAVPALAEGHSMRLRMDGKTVDSNTSGSFSIQAWERGSHSLVAELLDAGGKVLLSSPPITIHVHRTSILNPNHPRNREKQK